MHSPDQSGATARGDQETGEFAAIKVADLLAASRHEFDSPVTVGSATEEAIYRGHHPELNQDAHYANPSDYSMGVFDGVGSNVGSGNVSKLAAETVEDFFFIQPRVASFKEADEIMTDAILAANKVVAEVGQKDPDAIAANQAKKEGTADVFPATTATVSRIFEDENGHDYLVVAWVGDSRAFISSDNELEILTLDDGLHYGAQTKAEKRALQTKLAELKVPSELTGYDAVAYKFRYVITQALGFCDSEKPLDVHIVRRYLNPGDRIVLTSDGITDSATTADIARVLAANPNDQEAADALILAAVSVKFDYEQGARFKDDDRTATVMTYHGK